MNNYGKSLLAGIMAMGGSLCAQDLPVVKQTNKDLASSLQLQWKDDLEKQDKAYRKLVRKLAKEYSKSHADWHYHGKKKELLPMYDYDISWNSINQYGKKEDLYTKRFRSSGQRFHLDGKDPNSPIEMFEERNNLQFGLFADREQFYQQLLRWYGNGEYGLLIKSTWERDDAYKICDTIREPMFDRIIEKTENAPLIWNRNDICSFDASGWKLNFKAMISKCSQEEKLLWLLPELYYDQLKGHEYETYGTLMDKPSDKMFKFANKHDLSLNKEILILKNITSYDTKQHKADKIELRWICVRVPGKINIETTWRVYTPKDTITQTQIKETEKQMNEIFSYGKKVIFKSNQSDFTGEKVEEWLDKLYEMLEKNIALKIKITGYYWGTHPTLPLERAEKVKKYLIKKGIAAERITTEWWKEKFSQSIKIEIIKDEEKK